MPSTQLYNKGSDNSVFSHPVYTNVKRSRFNLSKKKFFTGDIGMIMPVDLIPTLPGDDFEISCSYILDTLPLIAPSMTNYKVRTHWYYIDNNSLWKGWSTFITKGRSGSIELSVPFSTSTSQCFDCFPLGDYYGYLDIVDFRASPTSPMSLSSFLGLNPTSMTGDPSSLDSDTNYSDTYYPQANYLPNAGLGSWLYVNNYTINSDGSVTDEDGSDVSLATDNGRLNYFYNISNSKNPASFNILPFLFYQKIYRQNYLNENLMQDNKVWFPDDITDGWRINYSASNLYAASGYSALSSGSGLLFTPSDSIDYYAFSSYLSMSNTVLTSSSSYGICGNTVPKVTDNIVHLGQLRYAMFDNDYFTTALPWQQRGTAPTLEGAGSAVWDSDTVISYDNYTVPTTSTLSVSSSSIDYGALGFIANDDGQFVLAVPAEPGSVSVAYTNGSFEASSANGHTLTAYGSSSSTVVSSMLDNWIAALNNNTVALGINLGDIRSLMALSVWQERNARTNGNYNSTIYAHFEQNPKQNEFEPVYIGGTSDNVQFTRVIQTSESSSDSPLGSEAGFGSLQANGFVGRFHCNDYGFIMGVMIISPEVSYAQEIQHFWTELSQSDYYMPEFSSLSLQPILNYEIFPQGTASTDTSDDSDSGLFGYQERYTYLKQRPNTTSGLFALPSDVDTLFSAYAQERWFDSLPQLSQQFVTMSPDNIRRDWLAYPSQPAFKIQFASNIFATRPLPYQNVPATFGF